jgi:hypothetical protein
MLWLHGSHAVANGVLCCAVWRVSNSVLFMLLLLPGVLEDEHYDHGDEGEETYEHLGPILVRQSEQHTCC